MMAGMLTLILTGLLRGIRTQRSLVFENLALRQQLGALSLAKTSSPSGDDPVVGQNLVRVG